MKHYEHRYYDFIFAAAAPQAAGTLWTPAPFILDVEEMGEVVWAEVFAPVALGGEELILRWYPVLDGNNYDAHLSLGGTRSENMTPPEQVSLGGVVAFGTPFANAMKTPATAMIENTCPKFKKQIGVESMAGVGGISVPYTIRLHCYIYRTDELAAIGTVMPGLESINDAPRRRIIQVKKADVPVSYENWDNLPGGLDQTAPMIHPYWRWATNFIATTVNTDYNFRVLSGTINPVLPWQELYWNFEDGEDILIVKGVGIRADNAGSLMETVLKIDGDDHPRTRIPTAFDPALANPLANALHYGQIFPLDAVGDPWFKRIPKFDRPYIIYNEIGEVNVRDNGVAVLAGAMRVALNGAHIELV